MRPTISTGPLFLAALSEPHSSVSKSNVKELEQPENIKKSTVRIDAFLGEWLSPDYFDMITPPPSSVLMVAGAKADLLRKEDYSNLLHARDISTPLFNQPFPGGWGSPVVLAQKDRDEGPLHNLSSLGQALTRRDRTSSLSSVDSSVGNKGSQYTGRSATSAPLAALSEHGIYQAPVPNYAVSSSDAIPPGFVAHARDSCVNVDYQWDSMREPQDWGNGGEYGEEWSSMHKRFRKGLQNLVSWYTDSDDPAKLLTKSPASPGNLTGTEESCADEDTDLVIILVTHGAGCNALIGALTNQPVLLDVGMASLTMAVRKPTPINSPMSTPGYSRASSRNLSISDQYEVKLVANTEHLRPSTTNTPLNSRVPSLAGIAPFRDRYGNSTGSLDGSNFGSAKPIPLTPSGNFGSIRRTASIASAGPRSYVPARQSSIGLWSASAREEEPSEPEDDMILNFGNDGTADTKPAEGDKEVEEEAITDKNEEDEVTPLGLWGSPRPPGYAEKIREIAPKRRWTVNERS